MDKNHLRIAVLMVLSLTVKALNPCTNYGILDSFNRSVANKDQKNLSCDKSHLSPLPAWYRFTGAAGDRMPTSCVPKNRCGTHAPGWLNGSHPSVKEGIVTRRVCYHWYSKCCNWQNDIQIRNCSAFYVYRLVKPPVCSLRYCGNNEVIKCPALTVSRLVQTSPKSCLTSPMDISAICSFSCPQGYKLEGPSSTQCELRGVWTEDDTVICIDINECEMLNGGCSHKCVNTEGDFKCECPDPELSLSSDRRTCYAPGVMVQCKSDNMTITIPKSLFLGMDRKHLRLLDTSCKATETSTHFSLTTPLTGCNTTSRHTPTAIVYSNAVLEIPVAAQGVVTRVREIEIKFQCFYSKYGVVSSFGWKPSDKKLVFSDKMEGNFTLSLDMFPDKRFESPYLRNDFPVSVVLRKLLFFEVAVTAHDKRLSIRAERCYATPTQDRDNSLKYEFIKEGCPINPTVQYYPLPSVSVQRFSLEAFKFIANHPFVFVHCHVIVCNATDAGSKCARSCPSAGRLRRDVNPSANDVYSLAKGPIHLQRIRSEERQSTGLERLGSSPTITMTLFVICVACLAGTALMAFKKLRDKPFGYAVVAAGEKN